MPVSSCRVVTPDGPRFTVSTSNAGYFGFSSPTRCPHADTVEQFVEDEGDIVFYKNAHGLAAARPLVIDANASDSGVDVHEKDS